MSRNELLNQIFSWMNFPEILKYSKGAPFFETDVKNHIIGKMLEILFKNQLCGYFEAKKCLNKNQYGFCAGKLTSQSLKGFKVQTLCRYTV